MTNATTIADRLTRHADTALRRALRSAGTAEEQTVVRNDHADLLAIAGMIRSNRLSTAWRCMGWLDTAVAEEVPSSVWNWVERQVL